MSSDPIEPTRVWTAEEWERRLDWGVSPGTIWFTETPMFQPGDIVRLVMKDGKVVSFDVEA